MPGQDGTGPYGKGPNGRKQGPCSNGGESYQQPFLGRGRGFGGRRRGFGFGQGMGFPISNEDRTKLLEEQLKGINGLKKSIEEELKSLKKED
ncbi:MAG: DUF5320 domain-containing protein [Nanoarchaeota archaeon]|nr:DUF5320 domain-containing protein [Nanoarchaeota archaeon]